MILGFSTHFDKAKTEPTKFPEKILTVFQRQAWDEGLEQYHKIAKHIKTLQNIDVAGVLMWGYENALKIHSIRGGNRWDSSKTIHFATGSRTPNYQCFMRARCVSVQDIQIKFDYENINCILVWVDGRFIHPKELKELAHNDGLTLDQFKQWFWKYTKKGSIPFNGQIIHWTNKRY